ncbi:hypothetical protein ALQ08_104239 [Pseudomonas syringae pv. delphinii]|uniref:Uncharacterized protein n=1 Tax=Pseudomonas syringae pv. delphinii TaxID=192088 RepID=A0A3M4K7A0_9PSED|nr:hypothetical protein ALQ08_104239 [Pseudomonas syringae pv. delphinii]
MCADRATLRSFALSRFCRSGLVRELPGTGSKIYAYGTSDTAEVTRFRAASQPFADKSASTPSGQKRVMCTGARYRHDNELSVLLIRPVRQPLRPMPWPGPLPG